MAVTLAQTMRGRWPAAADSRPDLAPLKAAAWRALDCHEQIGPAVKGKRAEFGKSGALSAKGVDQKVRKWLAEGFVGELRGHRKAVAERAEQLKARREALAKPQFDRADLVGELQRAELRGYLRSLDPSARLVALIGDKDGTMIEACLAGSPVLSGTDRLSDEQRGQVVARYLEARHAPTLAALAVEQDALELAAVSLKAATDELSDASGLRRHQFDAWLETGVDPELEGA